MKNGKAEAGVTVAYVLLRLNHCGVAYASAGSNALHMDAWTDIDAAVVVCLDNGGLHIVDGSLGIVSYLEDNLSCLVGNEFQHSF